MSDLKPCPFCGGEAKTEQVERIHYGTVYRVGCHTDGCRGWWYESVLYRTEAKAIEAWNTRTPEQAIAATLGSRPDEIELTQTYDAGFKNGVMAVFQQLEGIESYEELQDLIAEYWGEGEGNDER